MVHAARTFYIALMPVLAPLKADEKDKLAVDLDESLSRSANRILSGSRGCPKRPVNDRKQAKSTSNGLNLTRRKQHCCRKNCNRIGRQSANISSSLSKYCTSSICFYLCITMSSQNYLSITPRRRCSAQTCYLFILPSN